LRTDPGLREVDVGEWSGLTWPEMRTRFPESVERHTARGHGWERGESYEEMAERVISSLRRIADLHRGERVLVVVHGGTMRAQAERQQRRKRGPPRCELREQAGEEDRHLRIPEIAQQTLAERDRRRHRGPSSWRRQQHRRPVPQRREQRMAAEVDEVHGAGEL